MSNLNIANRYANALMKLAADKNSFDAVSADVELIFNTLRSSRELQLTLINPVIKSSVKHSILSEIFESRLNPFSLGFIQFVVKKNREDLLFNIVRQFLAIRDKRLGILHAEVASALQMSDEQRSRLIERLEAMTGKKIRLSYSVNSNMIGGFIVRIEDTVYDASVKHQLELLKEKLLKENYSMN